MDAILEFNFVLSSNNRSSRLEVFCEKRSLKNFAKFTGKHLCQCPFVIKLQGQVCNFINKGTPRNFFEKPFLAASAITRVNL